MVATPIGNRADISARALSVLSSVDIVLAEDTRHSRQLLDFYQINARFWSLHQHNERERCQSVCDAIAAGKALALVSDAGTPAISDPGFVVVRALRQAGLPVYAVPGPCALVAALSVAGISCQRFIFDGFLPSKAAARAAQYAGYRHNDRTVVLYEAAHRIVDSLTDLISALGADCQIAVLRELSKQYETCLSGTAVDVKNMVCDDSNQQKGEFVIVIAPQALAEADDSDILRVLQPLQGVLPPKKAAALAAELCGCSKKYAYELALANKR